MTTRRAFLFGALATGALAGCGSGLPHGVPDVSAGPRVNGSFVSVERGGVRKSRTIGYPPGHRAGARLPVLVVLHGRGGDHRDAFDRSLHLDRYLASAVRSGATPFALASVDGGDHSYWHPRRDGDPAGMVAREFVPVLAEQGLDVSRFGLLGWSMGGYGALYLSSVLGAARVAVCIAESPAIWRHSWQSVAGAFDDAQDFQAHAIFPRVSGLRDIAMRLDCGDRDGFAPVTRDLRAAISPTPAGGIEPGGHDATFWRSQAPAQLRFAARHLARP